MRPIIRIDEIPFLQRDAQDLLNLGVHREIPDGDYTGFGYALIEEIRLEAFALSEPIVLRDVLLLAMHSIEDPGESPDDLELEFFVPEVSADYSVTVLLSMFLSIWLPKIRARESAIVLAVCNPHEIRLPTPTTGNTPFYYPLGDVESWLEAEDGRRIPCLTAAGWELT